MPYRGHQTSGRQEPAAANLGGSVVKDFHLAIAAISDWLRGAHMEEKKRLRTLCLVCGRPSLRPICALCAARLKREALREEIEDEKHGKRPAHLVQE